MSARAAVALLLFVAGCTRVGFGSGADFPARGGDGVIISGPPVDIRGDRAGSERSSVHDGGGADRPAGPCTWHTVALPVAYTGYDVTDVDGWATGMVVLLNRWEKPPNLPWRWLGGVVLISNQGGLAPIWTAPPGPLVRARALGPTDIYVVGHQRGLDGATFLAGNIWHYDAAGNWKSEHTSPTDSPVNIVSLVTGEPAIAGCVVSGGTCVQGLVMVKQATGGWTRMVASTATDLYGIWGTNNAIVAAGWPGALLLYGIGGTLQVLPGGGSGRYFTVWGTGSSVFVGGSPGFFVFSLSKPALSSVSTAVIHDISAVSPSLAFAAGCRSTSGSCAASTVLRYDGAGWKALPDPPGTVVVAILARGECDLWATGAAGLLHYAP